MEILKQIGAVLLRSISSVIVLFILTRAMGKKHISQLTFFDYVIGITVGAIAGALAVDAKTSYIDAFISIIVYSLFSIFLSKITFHSIKMRKFIDGSPIILIQNGVIIEKNLKKSKYNLDNLLETCRLNNAFNIKDIKYAILETNGKVSMILYEDKQTVKIHDLDVKVKPQGLYATLILQGKLISDHLELLELNEEWLKKELKKKNITNYDEVILASYDQINKKLLINKKEENLKVLDFIN